MLEDDRVALAFIDIGHAAAIDLEKFLFCVGLSTDCHDVQLLYEYALQFEPRRRTMRITHNEQRQMW
jgi:hypothetical protein